jgi:hypothetical protein
VNPFAKSASSATISEYVPITVVTWAIISPPSR